MSEVIAFDIGGTRSRIALFENQTIVWRHELPTPRHGGPDAMLECMLELFRPVSRRHATIGVAITGHIRDACVTAHNSALIPGWQNYPLQRKLEAALQATVVLRNDARAAAWGEYVFGAGRGVADFMFLTVSTGIGAGLVLNHRLHLARNGLDSEIGEVKIAGANSSTLEDYASGTALNQWAQQLGFGDVRSLCDAAEMGDARAVKPYTRGVQAVAGVLANLAVSIGIERVAVGGGVGLRPGYLRQLQAELQNFPVLYRCELVPAQLGSDAGLYGMADLARAS